MSVGSCSWSTCNASRAGRQRRRRAPGPRAKLYLKAVFAIRPPAPGPAESPAPGRWCTTTSL
eukprot:1071406-Prymnesium_polylepis.1